MNYQALQGPSFFGVPTTPNYPQTSSVNYFKPSNEEKPQVNNIDNSNKTDETKQTPSIFKNASSMATENLLFPDSLNQNLPKLQNIVSTANLRCTLILRDIALKAKNAEYNPKRFAAVIMRIKEPKTTALIFASGKMVCTGARSEEDSRKAARQYAKIIQKLGFPVKFSEFKIQNIVASCDVKFPIRLEGLASNHLTFSSYEPEMFPGLIYHMVEPKIVLLIFVSGKIVLTGAKDRNDIYKAYHNIYPLLQKFRKKEINNMSTDLSVEDKEEEEI